MRFIFCSLLTIFFLFSSLLHAVNNDADHRAQYKNWFTVNTSEQNQVQTYQLIGSNIHPAALMEKLSLYSGIEIRYDKSIKEGLDFNMSDATLDELFRLVETRYSTLKAYTKNTQNEDVLTSLTVLPKGQFQSSELVLALDPVQEAVAHKQKATNENAKRVYVTRMETLEVKVRKNLEALAEKNIEQSAKRKEFKDQQAKEKAERRQQVIADLRVWQQKDPEIYRRKLAIVAWQYPGLEKELTNSAAINTEH